MTTELPVRLQILNELTRIAGLIEGVRGASYDSPLDLTRNELPWAYVYEGQETYEYDYVSRRSSTLEVGIAVAFRYRPDLLVSGPQPSNESLRRAGNALLAAAIKTFSDQQLLHDRQQVPLYYEALPKGAWIVDVPEQDEAAGAVVLELDVTYQTELSNPYSQLVA